MPGLVWLPLRAKVNKPSTVGHGVLDDCVGKDRVTGVVTLLHTTTLATISLLDGRSGLVTKDLAVYNRDSHVAFEIYGKDTLGVGIQGWQRGAILDLGSAQELEARYGYKETSAALRGASIHRTAGSLVIVARFFVSGARPGLFVL